MQPTDTWLRQDYPDGISGAVYLPDESGQFDLSDLTLHCTLIVVGVTISAGFARSDSSSTPQRASASLIQGATTSATAISNSSVSAVTTPPPPFFRSVVASKKILCSATIKIMQARLRFKKNRPDFQCFNQLHVQITESTATVKAISEAVQNQLGLNYTVTIVTTEGFEILDSPATRGMNKLQL